MIGPDAYFEDLLMRVVEGKATEDETATFGGIILMDRELRKVYALEMRVHALLCCKSKGQGALRGAASATGHGAMRTSFLPLDSLGGGEYASKIKVRPAPCPLRSSGKAGDDGRRRDWLGAGRKVAAAAALALAAAGLWLAAGDGRQATGDGRVAAAEKPAGP
ncbi:MAG: hypothetical protein PHG71_08850, partial [Kiritimatiellae bacterium]|nr:hypothetical protein [Kiritimatiellia bacterium]